MFRSVVAAAPNATRAARSKALLAAQYFSYEREDPRAAFKNLPARAASESLAGGLREPWPSAWCRPCRTGAVRRSEGKIQVIEKCLFLAEREGFEPSKGF